MQLIVDNVVCDLEAGTRIALGYDADRLRSPSELREGVAV